MTEQSRQKRTMAVAQRATDLLASEGIATALIGALAAAAHGYSRATEDADLATIAEPFTHLRTLVQALQREGFNAELITPDADDSLGGVVNITGDDFDTVQIVNFYNPFRATRSPALEAIRSSLPDMIEGFTIRVVDLAHLIALKLYAGGPKNRNDVLELLDRNPTADREALRLVCDRFGLAKDFDELAAGRG